MNELCFGVYIETKNCSMQGESLIKELIATDYEATLDMKTIGILARNSAVFFRKLFKSRSVSQKLFELP